MTTQLRLLGPPTLDLDGDAVALPAERRTRLMAFLALRRAWVSRTELAALFWPDVPAKLAFTNLRKALFRLQAVEWGRQVESEGGALRCQALTDVVAFEEALAQGRRADALALWHGELLEGFDDEANPSWSSWLAFERERLHGAWRVAALGLLDEDIGAAQAMTIAQRLLEADPLDEAALRAQMTWLARSGQAARARQVYREFATRLETELGIAPGAQLRAQHDALGAPVAATAPTRAAGETAVDAGFVGRAVELRQVATMLADARCRLLTVIGAGGVGKTRFVQRALADVAPGYAHGAAFVPLEDVHAVADVPARLAQELGLRVLARHPPLEVVREFLAPRQMLLVLDNFEHLVGASAMVEELLAAAPGLRIVTTSRMRLGLAAEQLLPLDGLPYPEPEDGDRIEAFDAGRLFLQAARRVEPALVTSVEATAIADICRQLDGLPLALELAASWTRVLSCDAIAAEIREGTGLLRVVDPARPARHASFEVVFDHSWRLLHDVEREALARLSVFRGGFSPEAARSVTKAPLPVLLALVDKSLLRKEGARLHLHPLVAELAAARLAGREADGTTRGAHAGYFMRLLAHHAPALDRGVTDAMRAVEADFENCRAAWRVALAEATSEMLLDAARALVAYCDHRGLASLASSLLEEGLRSPAAKDRKVRLDLASRRAHLHYRLDQYDEAATLADSVLAEAQPERDAPAILQALYVQGGSSLRRGELAQARQYYRRALSLASRRGNPREVAALLDNLSIVAKRLGNVDEALKLTVRALATLRRIDDPANLALCLSNLGSHYQQRGDFASARVHLAEAQALTDRHGLVSTRAFVCANLAMCDRHLGDLEAAGAHIGQAMTAAEAAGNRSVMCWLHYQRSSLALLHGDLSTAREELATMAAVATEIASPYLTIGAVDLLAEVLAAQEHVDCARQLLRFAMTHAATDRAQSSELAARLAALPQVPTERPWPGLELAELAHRITSEKDLAHAPLIAVLRGAG